MYQKLLRRNRGLLAGLEISSSSVKLVALSKLATGFQLEAIATTNLSHRAVVAKEIKNPSLVADAIRLCIRQTNLTITQAAIALADSLVITKIITIAPNLTPAEQEAEVILAAEQSIPFQLNEIQLDYQLLPATMDDDHQQQVLLAAARSKDIALYQQALTEAGLTLTCVDIESHCLSRACSLIESQLPLTTTTATQAIINIDAQQIQMIVIQQQIPIFIHSETYTTQLFNHITHTWQLYYAHHDATAIDQIILVGSITELTTLQNQLIEQLKLPVLLANPFKAMVIPKHLVELPLSNQASAYFLTCGLALRGGNRC